METRRGFFASLASLAKPKEDKPFHPLLPGFISEKSHQCHTCETSSCQQVCEEGIVVREEGGSPYLDFSRRGCTFCGECIQACENDCFVAEPVERLEATVEIGILNCLAWNKTICRTCADVCNEKAIHFTGLFNPQIDPARCSACGFCIGVCPAYTISVKAPSLKGDTR
ncbi:MAG: 4Fe-4S dicluster domain-containing protein [Sulfuricurvum sp.]